MKEGVVDTCSVYHIAPAEGFQDNVGSSGALLPIGGEASVGAGGGSTPVPPVVVRRIVPPFPTVVPVLASVKKTPKSAFVPVVWLTQVVPPSVV